MTPEFSRTALQNRSRKASSAFRPFRAALALCGLLLVALSSSVAFAVDDGITLVVRDTEIREVLEMLARTEGLSIALGDEIAGRVSISLFDVSPEEAVSAIAQAAGYAIERRQDTYVIVDFESVGQDSANGATTVRSFKIQYSDVENIRLILEKHLSRYGKITALPDRRLLVVEDMPEFLDRIDRILLEVDRQPQQVLLEAKVLEVTLSDNDTLGVDWSRVSSLNGSELNIGLRGLTSGTAPGLFFNLLSDNLEGAIEALTEQGRIRTLASPRLLAMDNEEAEVLVGERLGFRVTTTINQVTTESVEFIDSGVILRFTPSVDRQGRILLKMHPEVSTGSISDGIPSVKTTEVTTSLLTENGQRVFIGGLIRDSATETRRGIPFLSRIPFLGLLFSRSEWTNRSTETIVIVRATLRNPGEATPQDLGQTERLGQFEPELDTKRSAMEDDLDLQPWNPKITPRDAELAPTMPLLEAPAAARFGPDETEALNRVDR
ncbi:MAG: type II secretion system protein GspD [Myxococcota bacterium]